MTLHQEDHPACNRLKDIYQAKKGVAPDLFFKGNTNNKFLLHDETITSVYRQVYLLASTKRKTQDLQK